MSGVYCGADKTVKNKKILDKKISVLIVFEIRSADLSDEERCEYIFV